MKTYSLIMALLILTIGCDAPRRTRAPAVISNGSTFQNGENSDGFSPPTGGSNIGEVTEPGFETCDLTQKYHTIDTGHFGICQSTQDETSFKFRPGLTSTSIRTCLIPTYKDQSGSSTYVGQPQCTYTTANKIVNGKLYKDRQGFNSYPLNGVIVMKEPLLPEYIGCMHGYTNWPSNVCQYGASNSYCAYWLPRCPTGARSNAACDTEAKNHMAKICTTFKSKYSNSYIDIQVK